MSWVILFLAGLFEVGWAVGLKYTDGFTRPLPTLLTVTAMIISLGLLGAGHEGAAPRHCLCDLDRRRRSRHSNRRYPAIW